MQNAPIESSTALRATLFAKNPKCDPDQKNGRAGHKTKRVANLIALRPGRSSRDPGTPQVVGRSFAPPFMYSELTELPGGRVVRHTREPPGKGLTKRIEGVGAPSRSPWRDIKTAKCCGILCNSASPLRPGNRVDDRDVH